MKPRLRTEFVRKAFHLLSLIYLAGYFFWGTPDILRVLGGWIILEGILEAVRLNIPSLNRYLIELFGSIHRPAEENRISGIFWTSVGCWLTFFFFGGRPSVVTAALFYLSVGDAAAALVGIGFGKRRIPFLREHKTVEGTFACFAACVACGWAAGLNPSAMICGALAAAIIELVPLPLNDNLWLPLGSGLVVQLF